MIPPHIRCWILLYDQMPTEHKEESGVGNVFNVDYNHIDDMLPDLFLYMQDIVYESEVPVGAMIAEFIASEFTHQEGEMTYPENAQWDFPPYWEMNVVLTGFKVENDEQEPA